MKRMGIFVLLAFLLVGCKKQEMPATRVVTGAQVEYQRNGETISRTYTKPSSVQSVLTYLRILRPFGPTVPQGSFDSACNITLHYSHGPDTVYFQQGNKYICRNGGDWQYIDNARANLLYPLLLLLPSDG